MGKSVRNNTWIWLISGALVASVIAYSFYVPVPHKIAERHKMRVFEFIMRILYYYPVKLMAMLGPVVEEQWGMQLFWTRYMLGFLSQAMGPWTFTDPDVAMVDTDFDGIPTRIYIPKGPRANNGTIFFIHGGGFVTLDTLSYEGILRSLARDSRMLVIAVEYRLAPEHVFPAAIEDCERAMLHLLQTRHEALGVDPSRVAVMGDSAGGNLAAVIAQRLRARTDLPALKLQVLIYPLMQYVDFLTPSYQLYYREYHGTAFLDPETIVRSLMLYIGVKPETHVVEHVLSNNHALAHVRLSAPQLKHLDHDRLPASFSANATKPTIPHGNDSTYSLFANYLFNPDFSPLMHPDLTGLPKTMLLTCEYDILRDEGFWYAERLKEANVEVEYKHYDTGFHAFLNFAMDLDVAKEAIRDMATYVLKNI